MNALAAAPPTPWTCPCCPLLCDDLGLTADAATGALRLTGSDCPRATKTLATLKAGAAPARPQVGGNDCDLATALAAAAQALRRSRQALFAGLGCDVAAARVVYRLAHDSGAICDAIGGDALFHGVRALQDRGAFTTTLAEVRTRADVVVCFGGSPQARLPEFFRRCGIGDNALVAARHVVFVGGDGSDALPLAGLPGISSEVLPLEGDLFDSAALLCNAVLGRGAPAPWQALAQRLRAAAYAVLVYEASRLPPQGALIVEALNRAVGSLNRETRAATLPLGGGDGAATSNQVHAWLSGLPLRSRVSAAGIEHEPLRFATARLLADAAVDLLLWVQPFDAAALPPVAANTPGLARIVLGPPAMAAPLAGSSADTVFIPVATPGIGAPGHLFRTDSTVLMPLHAAVDQGLPSPADVITQLHAAWQGTPP